MEQGAPVVTPPKKIPKKTLTVIILVCVGTAVVAVAVAIYLVVRAAEKNAAATPDKRCPPQTPNYCKITKSCRPACSGIFKWDPDTCDQGNGCNACDTGVAMKCTTEKACRASGKACTDDDDCGSRDVCIQNDLFGKCVTLCAGKQTMLDSCTCACLPPFVRNPSTSQCEEKVSCSATVDKKTGEITGTFYDPKTNTCVSRNDCQPDCNTWCQEKGWDGYFQGRCAKRKNCAKEMLTSSRCPSQMLACNSVNKALLDDGTLKIPLQDSDDGFGECRIPKGDSDIWKTACNAHSRDGYEWDTERQVCANQSPRQILVHLTATPNSYGTYVYQNATLTTLVALQFPDVLQDIINPTQIRWMYTLSRLDGGADDVVHASINVATDTITPSPSAASLQQSITQKHTVDASSLFSTSGGVSSYGIQISKVVGTFAQSGITYTWSTMIDATGQPVTTVPAGENQEIQMQSPVGVYAAPSSWNIDAAKKIAQSSGDLGTLAKNKSIVLTSGSKTKSQPLQTTQDPKLPSSTSHNRSTQPNQPFVAPLTSTFLHQNLFSDSNVDVTQMAVILSWADSRDQLKQALNLPDSPPTSCNDDSSRGDVTPFVALYRRDALNPSKWNPLLNVPALTADTDGAPPPTAWLDLAEAGSVVDYRLITYFASTKNTDALTTAKCRSKALRGQVIVPLYTTKLCAAIPISEYAGVDKTQLPPFAWMYNGACVWADAASSQYGGTPRHVADAYCIFGFDKNNNMKIQTPIPTSPGGESVAGDFKLSVKPAGNDATCAALTLNDGDFDANGNTLGFAEQHCQSKSLNLDICIGGKSEGVDTQRTYTCDNKYRLGKNDQVTTEDCGDEGCTFLQERVQRAYDWTTKHQLAFNADWNPLVFEDTVEPGVRDLLYKPLLMEHCPPLRGGPEQSGVSMTTTEMQSQWGVPTSNDAEAVCTLDKSTFNDSKCEKWMHAAGTGTSPSDGPSSILENWNCELQLEYHNQWKCTQQRACFAPYVQGGANADGTPLSNGQSACCNSQGTWTPPVVVDNTLKSAGSCACFSVDSNTKYTGTQCTGTEKARWCLELDTGAQYGVPAAPKGYKCSQTYDRTKPGCDFDTKHECMSSATMQNNGGCALGWERDAKGTCSTRAYTAKLENMIVKRKATTGTASSGANSWKKSAYWPERHNSACGSYPDACYHEGGRPDGVNCLTDGCCTAFTQQSACPSDKPGFPYKSPYLTNAYGLLGCPDRRACYMMTVGDCNNNMTETWQKGLDKTATTARWTENPPRECDPKNMCSIPCSFDPSTFQQDGHTWSVDASDINTFLNESKMTTTAKATAPVTAFMQQYCADQWGTGTAGQTLCHTFFPDALHVDPKAP